MCGERERWGQFTAVQLQVIPILISFNIFLLDNLISKFSVGLKVYIILIISTKPYINLKLFSISQINIKIIIIYTFETQENENRYIF